ncbi:hypothetical protein L1987_45960 [Smallanthus sonchifolius]|uniref:Uncharacterized protein n=1 Tax=Smallanthus sonchifolius TaxID=185202 RepID=A0ACB9FZ24_9ASTR|nr:hypothetical protein L1987_45960 [Smallanthus sonchifolius]
MLKDKWKTQRKTVYRNTMKSEEKERKHDDLVKPQSKKKKVNVSVTSKSSKKHHDDDDDFENPLTISLPKQQVQTIIAYNGKKLLPRSTPSNLYNWMAVMNEAQRQTVSQMGFRSILNLKNATSKRTNQQLQKQKRMSPGREVKKPRTGRTEKQKKMEEKTKEEMKENRIAMKETKKDDDAIKELGWYDNVEEDKIETKEDEQHGEKEMD